jgi:hypothetical protein
MLERNCRESKLEKLSNAPNGSAGRGSVTTLYTFVLSPFFSIFLSLAYSGLFPYYIFLSNLLILFVFLSFFYFFLFPFSLLLLISSFLF